MDGDTARRYGAEETYLAIRGQIVDGSRRSDEWLREGELAAALGVSRTPVREALRRLVAEGLARHEPNRGVRVKSWSVHDLDEIFDLRGVLEPWASSLAATSGAADLEELQRLADAMDAVAAERRPDFEELTRLNNDFHRGITEASGNNRLCELITSVVEVPLVWRTFSHYSPAALRRSLDHHHELVDALATHDPDWAESVMRSHIRGARAALQPYVDEHLRAADGGRDGVLGEVPA